MNFSSVTTVIFDIGNTLVNVNYAEIVNAAKEQGIDLDINQLRRAEHAGKRYIDDQVLASTNSADKARWDEYFVEILKATGYPENLIPKLIKEIQRRDDIGFGIWSSKSPDTDAVLSELHKRGYDLGVISNADGRIKGLLDHLGLSRYFRIVIDSHVVGIEKPNPAIFSLALEKLGCHAGQAVYIGDIYTVDALGAGSVGITPLLLDPFGQYLVADCVTIRNLKEMLDILPENPGGIS